nr:C13 family peptidase [Candidatus Sigynarchaeota archaeon]
MMRFKQTFAVMHHGGKPMNVKRQHIIIVLLLSTMFPMAFIPATSATTTRLQEIKASTMDEKLGAFIIIAGDRWDHELVGLMKNDGNRAYNILRMLGFPASAIYYLGPNYGGLPSKANGSATLANIQYAIETWAKPKISSTRGLGIYLIDHGGTNYMCLGGVTGSGGDLTDSDFNTWLNNLEASSGCKRMVIVYEACHAGSFINPVSKDNRIVLCSTSSADGAYITDDEQHALFSKAFWSAILCGNTLGGSFEYGRWFVNDYGYGSYQHPWMDDNHDEVGHEVSGSGVLPNGGDGSDALDTKIQYGAVFHVYPLLVQMLPLPFFVNSSKPGIPIWAKISNTTAIKNVTARFLPPGWNPPPMVTDQWGSYPVAPVGIPHVLLEDPDGDGNWTGMMPFPGAALYPDGPTRINVLVESEGDGDEDYFAAGSTTGTVNDNGTAPPDAVAPTVAIKFPFDATNVSGTINFTAAGDDDQALDKIEFRIDDVSVGNETMPAYYPYPDAIHLLNTARLPNGNHTFEVVAYDKAGNTATASVVVNIQNQAIPAAGWSWFGIFGLTGLVFVLVDGFLKRRFNRA